MIFAHGEDNGLTVFDDISEIRGKCEGIDVESGVWDFYNEKGVALTPVFNTPNVEKKLLFVLRIVNSSQDFELVEAAGEPSLLLSLNPEVVVEKNPHFSNLAEVVAYLEKVAA